MKSQYLQKFFKERNIRLSTQKCYESALKKYISYHNLSLDELINEAIMEEDERIPLKERKLKKRLIDFISFILEGNVSDTTSRTYFSNVKSFYRHFEVEIPYLPSIKYNRNYESNYFDIPTKDHIAQALDIVSIDLKALILFMSSSGTAKAETLSLSVGDFISATSEYHSGGSLNQILNVLGENDSVVPTFYLKRIKTDKYYYTFCSPQATSAIVKYLKSRTNLSIDDKLFDFTDSIIMIRFKEINDSLGWGFKGKYRFFRSHTLRKFHASNIGLSVEYIDALQGRSKNEVHEAYVKTNPKKLKEIYMSAMKNVMIDIGNSDESITQEFTIVVNVFLSGKEYNIL